MISGLRRRIEKLERARQADSGAMVPAYEVRKTTEMLYRKLGLTPPQDRKYRAYRAEEDTVESARRVREKLVRAINAKKLGAVLERMADTADTESMETVLRLTSDEQLEALVGNDQEN